MAKLDPEATIFAQTPVEPSLIDRRVARVALLAVVLGVCATLIALALTMLIAFVTNLSFYGRFSVEPVSPAENHLGLWVVVVPILGAIVIGFMARYGSSAIRGHGIPEAMETVLTNRSRIPARVTFLKPLSAAISIGTGGPFGAEGPIIATGSALGSLIGQLLHITASERKTLLAAGAAAGMTATFGSPVSAVLLAIELLLFEFRARSLIPVALASATAAGMRIYFEGAEAAFIMPHVPAATLSALVFYAVLGAILGLAAAAITRMLYGIEDAFERLPIHWMWWPALGAVVVGVVGFVAPKTLGVGYENISAILSGEMAISAVLWLCLFKLISWSIALGSGTSGGTLAPMFTIGGGGGALLGAAAVTLLPAAGIDIRVAALVGMASLFAGASRAVLASAVFAFETTHEMNGILPLLTGCTTAYFVSCLVLRNTIMTEKIARRGVRAPSQYTADGLDQILVTEVASRDVVALQMTDSLSEVRDWLLAEQKDSKHQGYPVLDANEVLQGVITRRDLLAPEPDTALLVSELIHRSPKYVYDDCSARQAADHMANHDIGRLPVVTREAPHHVVGILTRSDILSCFRRQTADDTSESPTLRFPRFGRNNSHA